MLIYQLSLGSIIKQFNYTNSYRLKHCPPSFSRSWKKHLGSRWWHLLPCIHARGHWGAWATGLLSDDIGCLLRLNMVLISWAQPLQPFSASLPHNWDSWHGSGSQIWSKHSLSNWQFQTWTGTWNIGVVDFFSHPAAIPFFLTSPDSYIEKYCSHMMWNLWDKVKPKAAILLKKLRGSLKAPSIGLYSFTSQPSQRGRGCDLSLAQYVAVLTGPLNQSQPDTTKPGLGLLRKKHFCSFTLDLKC